MPITAVCLCLHQILVQQINLFQMYVVDLVDSEWSKKLVHTGQLWCKILTTGFQSH